MGAQMRNKKFAPLVLRHLSNEVPQLDLTDECKDAFKEHAKKTLEKGFELIGVMFQYCFKDAESEECKKAQEDVKKQCKEEGHLCTITAKDKKGTEEESECIPKVYHDETDKIKEWIEATANHDNANIEECKDFDCEVTFACPEDE